MQEFRLTAAPVVLPTAQSLMHPPLKTKLF